MRINQKVLNKVLHRVLSAFVLSFAQNFLALAPTKNATIFNSDFSVLIVFKRLSFYPIYLFSKFSPLLFLSVKSLEANLVIKSDGRES
jgi:hypothetical protein